MTPQDFERFIDNFLGKMKTTMTQKNPDYRGTRSMFDFEQQAEELDVAPMQIWSVLASKHWAAIKRFAKDGKLSSESIESRFVDLANYCILGAALLEDLRANISLEELEAKTDDLEKRVVEFTREVYEKRKLQPLETHELGPMLQVAIKQLECGPNATWEHFLHDAKNCVQADWRPLIDQIGKWHQRTYSHPVPTKRALKDVLYTLGVDK